MQQKSSKVSQLIEPVLVQMGYELVGVEQVQNGRQMVLRVYIDKPEGITLDDCSKVSHQVSGVLDVEDVVSGAYVLEVSSPGMDRPLLKLADYSRFSGRGVNIRLSQPLNGRRNFKGLINGIEGGIEGEIVKIQVDHEEYKLVFEHIEKARLIPEFC